MPVRVLNPLATLLFACAASMSFAAPQAPPAVESPALFVRAGLLVPVEGEPLVDGAISVANGRILAVVGKGIAPPAGADVRTFPGGVIFPGLIDAASWAGVRRDRDE